MRPRDGLDQRRLARAVVADERDDLACVQLEVDVRERLHRAEALGDAAQLEQGRRPRGGSRQPEPAARARLRDQSA